MYHFSLSLSLGKSTKESRSLRDGVLIQSSTTLPCSGGPNLHDFTIFKELRLKEENMKMEARKKVTSRKLIFMIFRIFFKCFVKEKQFLISFQVTFKS